MPHNLLISASHWENTAASHMSSQSLRGEMNHRPQRLIVLWGVKDVRGKVTPRSVSYTPPEEILSSKSCWIKIHDRKDSTKSCKKCRRSLPFAEIEQDPQKPKPTGLLSYPHWQDYYHQVTAARPRGLKAVLCVILPPNSFPRARGYLAGPAHPQVIHQLKCLHVVLFHVHPLSKPQICLTSNACNMFTSWSWPTEGNSMW